MTAVAAPGFQQISRPLWTSSSNSSNSSLSSMNTDEVSRMFMPRKYSARQNPSALSSAAPLSSSSTSPFSSTSVHSVPSQTSSHPNPGHTSSGSDTKSNPWGFKRKAPRGLWPPNKTEASAGVSTARSHSTSSLVSGATAASSMSTIHQPASLLPSQHLYQSQPQSNPMRSSLSQRGDEHQPWLYLISINGTFERKSISVPYYPDILRIGRQTNAKTVPTSSNGFFDSKVLSRQHAEIWADPNGKIWIRDVKSSNGTFVNGERLSPENRESEPHELLAHDVLELGIDIVSEDQKSVVHQKVSARVEHVGHLSGLVESSNQLNFGDSDLNNQGGMIPPSLGHNIPHYRGRALDQQLNMGNRRSANAASNNLGAMAQHQRHLNFWLTPITMEHIVKKMTSELKSAKQQNMDLQRTTDFFSSLVTKNNISLPQNSDLSQCWKDELPEISPGDPNSPFHSPPAPPPKLPLPVKSEVSKPYPPQTPPRLNRSDTERPKLSGNLSSGDSDASYQILSLAEELAASKKEVESKSARVRDLEDLLVRERKARESAEDRARRLEVESGCLHEIVKDDKRSFQSNFSSGTLHDDIGIGVKENKDGKRQLPVEEDIDDMWDDSLNIDASTLRLQKRLDKMVNDMNEMKQLMEQYRCRAVDAEKERDSTRSSLAELVQKIRKDEMERDIKGQESKALTEFGINTLIQPLQLPKDSYKRMGNQAVIINGNPGGPVNISELRKLATSTAALATSRSSLGPRYQISPYASIFTVVILGVGLMAFLNNDWPKAEN